MARFTFTPNGFYNSNPSWTTQDGVYTYVIRWNGVDYWEWTNWPYGGEPRNYTSPPAFPINGWDLYNGTLTTEFNFTLGQCETPTPTPTITQTNTPTLTQTNTPGLSPSVTQTNTQTPTNTLTATNTPTNTNTQTPTNSVSPTRTASQTPTNTRTMTNTPSRTEKETPLPTRTPTQTPTNTATQTPTNTTTITKSVTPTTTKTPTNTNTPTMTSTSPLNRIFYVSSGGSDSNTVAQAQSTSTPWKTFIGVNANMSSFQPGDQILFKRGETFTNRTLTIAKSGISGRPITFGAYGAGNKPIFTFTYSGTGNNIVSIGNYRYINFENWNITDPNQPSPSGQTNVARGFALNGSSYINVDSFDFSYIGIGMNTVASGCSLTNSNYSNGRMIVNNPAPDNDFGGNPVVLAGSNNIITGNTFTECWAQSYDYGRDGGAIEIFGVSSSRAVDNNLIAYNTFYHTNGWAEFGAEKALSGDSTAYNNKFYYNKIINCGGMYAHWQNPQPNGTTFSIKMSGTEFYNNILVINESDWRGTPIFDLRTNYPWSDVMLVKNNIFYVSGVTGETVYDSTLAGTALVHENNVYNLATGVTFSVSSSIPIDSSELRTTTVQWRSITGDSFSWDYRLLAGASSINFGTDVGLTRDFSGNTVTIPPDAGILEF